MSVKVTGEKKLMDELERRLGKAKMQQVSDKALIRGTEVFIRELRSQVSTFSDGSRFSTRGTYDEITAGKPETINGNRTIRIYWRGPKGRYHIIHLNEWGTVKNPRPRGKGKIAAALKNAESEYRKVIKQAIKDGV